VKTNGSCATIYKDNRKMEEMRSEKKKPNPTSSSSSSSSWVLQPDSSQDRLNYASPPHPIRRYFFPVFNQQCFADLVEHCPTILLVVFL
jgi:hypothetical protein